MDQPREIEPRLAQISDTSVLLNFSKALGSLYPHMKAVLAHCYDPYDDVVESLFWALVYGTFADKYGVAVPRDQCQMYECVFGERRPLNYVRVSPRRLPLTVQGDGEQILLTEQLLEGSELVFINFGDGIHYLTSGAVQNDAYDVDFNQTRVQIFSLSQSQQPPIEPVLVWIDNENIDYEFVHSGMVAGAA